MWQRVGCPFLFQIKLTNTHRHTAAGDLMASWDIPGTCECYQWLFLQMWLSILKWGNYAALTGWALNATITSILVRERWKESRHGRGEVVWRREAESGVMQPQTEGLPAATRSWKRQEADSSLEPLEKYSPANTFISAQRNWLWTSSLQNWRRKNCVASSNQVYGNLL